MIKQGPTLLCFFYRYSMVLLLTGHQVTGWSIEKEIIFIWWRRPLSGEAFLIYLGSLWNICQPHRSYCVMQSILDKGIMYYFIIICRLPLCFPRWLLCVKWVTAGAGDAALGTNGYGWQNRLYYQGVGETMLLG
jgi:hypothetical protein